MVKNYKQILEAVNRGIKFALSDLEDDEELSSIGSLKLGLIEDKSYTRELLEWKQLTKKFELEQQTSNDILRLGKLSKITGLKYKISKERLYNFIRHYLNKRESLYHADLNWIDTSEIYTMENLFYESKFDGDISEWDVSNVINMSLMFYNSYFDGDISKWNVSNVKTMYGMFNSSDFQGDISNWDVSNVESMREMFQYTCFNNDISKWNVSKCRDFEKMFMNDSEFYQDLSSWKIKRGSDMGLTFWGTKTANNLKFMPLFV